MVTERNVAAASSQYVRLQGVERGGVDAAAAWTPTFVVGRKNT